MASRRQGKKISEHKKRKTRAATIRKKIVKMESKPTPQRKSSAARTGCSSRRQDTAGQAATPPVKDQDEEIHNERRRQDKSRICGVCGDGRLPDNDYFCPYNYIDGRFGSNTCREGCRPGGRHQLLLTTASGSGSHHQLRRLVRVTNVPLSAIPGERELCGLFKRFGPLIKCNLTRVSLDDSVAFGWIAFESREHAEEAINKLNGYLVGDRKLRVDWVYPLA